MILNKSKHLESKWELTRNGKIHARFCTTASSRDKPSVVLIHGLVISSLYMIPTADRLAASFPVYALDLPGFGRTTKPDHVLSIAELAEALDAWLDTLQLDRIVLVGNSLGCQIICELMVQYSPPVVAIILSGPSIDPYAKTTSQQFVRWLLNWSHEKPVLAVIQAIDFCRAGPLRAWKTFKYAQQHPMRDRLADISVPSLVVRGSEDRIVSHRWAEEVTRRLPKGELIEISGGSHMVNYTSADSFARIISDFINNLSI